MRKYHNVDVSEKELEDLIRQAPDHIEEGLVYLTHQRKTTGGSLDILLVDSGGAFVVSELKVIEDDKMLTQAIDYYDYIAENTEGFARSYDNKNINPTEDPRLLLIAPSFSQTLIKRCKWIDIPISLFTFQCIAFKDKPKEIIPVFKEITIPSRPETVEVSTIQQHLSYITDDIVRKRAQNLLTEIESWDKDNITLDPIKYSISIKVSGKVFTYIVTRRKFFVIHTYDNDESWKAFPIHDDSDLENAKELLIRNYEIYKH